MEDFQTLLKESSARHGHLCAGQVIGVRMAMLGCRLVSTEESRDLAKVFAPEELSPQRQQLVRI